MAVVVRGYSGLQRALARADKDTRLGVRRELRDVAEPVRRDAERLAVQGISRIGPDWSRMRTGITTRVVYVAPKQRGVKSRGLSARKRKNLAPLLATRALEPALDQNAAEVERQLGRALDHVADRFGT